MTRQTKFFIPVAKIILVHLCTTRDHCLVDSRADKTVAVLASADASNHAEVKIGQRFNFGFISKIDFSTFTL